MHRDAEPELPLIAIRNTATRRLFTTKNFDLLLYPDRLVAAQGLTLGSGTRTALREAASGGRSWAEVDAGGAQRIKDVAALADDELLARADGNVVLPMTEIFSARLSTHVGFAKLVIEAEGPAHSCGAG